MSSTRQVVISASRVVVGPSGQLRCPGAMLIDGAHISAVGAPEAVGAVRRPDALHLEYPGASVLPGLIDARVHLAFTGPPDPLAVYLQQIGSRHERFFRACMHLGSTSPR